MAVNIEGEVTKLYETHPYPNWHDKLTPEEVLRRIRLLGELGVPLEAFRDAIVLDAGCGTGEKTMIMATFGPKVVIGMDRALAPLRNAKAWAHDHGIDNVAFVQGSVLDLGFLHANAVDLVHCAGVLHHTADPARGVRELVRILRPGGYLVLYVYNPYGRAYIRFKQAIVRLLAGRQPQRREDWAKRLFRVWEEPSRDATAVFHDFYCHPHESYHPLGEVLGWLDQNGLVFSGISPSVSCREWCHAWAQRRRSLLAKRLVTWILPPHGTNSGVHRRPGLTRRFMVQLFALLYVLLRRTHVGWAVAGRKGQQDAD